MSSWGRFCFCDIEIDDLLFVSIFQCCIQKLAEAHFLLAFGLGAAYGVSTINKFLCDAWDSTSKFFTNFKVTYCSNVGVCVACECHSFCFWSPGFTKEQNLFGESVYPGHCNLWLRPCFVCHECLLWWALGLLWNTTNQKTLSWIPTSGIVEHVFVYCLSGSHLWNLLRLAASKSLETKTKES